MSNNGNNKKWTAEDAAYVRQNLGKVSLEDMAVWLAYSELTPFANGVKASARRVYFFIS